MRLRRSRFAFWTLVPALVLLVFLVQPQETLAQQWMTNGNDINNANPGNVGIGTTTPRGKFDVAGDGDIYLATSPNDGTTQSVYLPGHIYIAPYNGTNISYIQARRSNNTGSTELQLRTYNSSSLIEAMRISSAGNVGIGTTSPLHKLDVSGNMAIGSGYAASVTVPADGLIVQGNVGIGTANPRGQFDVAGAGDIFLANNPNTGTTQSVYLPGHIYIAPYNGTNISYIQARRPNDTGSTELQLRTYNSNSLIEAMRINSAGNVGIGTTTPTAKLDVNGDINVTGNINAKYQDLAEWVPARKLMPAGTVVVLDKAHSNQVQASFIAYDTRVAGVVSAQPGIALGEGGEGKVLVATTGRVKVRVDATRTAIEVGDLLVTSETEGVAMKSEPVMISGRPFHSPGTLIGKALEPMEKGQTGEILVLLSLQ